MIANGPAVTAPLIHYRQTLAEPSRAGSLEYLLGFLLLCWGDACGNVRVYVVHTVQNRRTCTICRLRLQGNAYREIVNVGQVSPSPRFLR